MESVIAFCRYCEKPIDTAKGRADRKYCDERCKNAFHNAKNNGENAELQRIELILRKNHRVLKKMFLRKDRDEISRERLLKEGFNFDYHTHHIISRFRQNEYLFCHGYGYRPIPGEKYKVVKAFDYKED